MGEEYEYKPSVGFFLCVSGPVQKEAETRISGQLRQFVRQRRCMERKKETKTGRNFWRIHSLVKLGPTPGT